MIELRRQDRLARLGDAEPRAHVVEGAGDRQRRRGEHRGAGAIEHQLAHDARHLDRQGAQEGAGAARLDEEHEGRIVGAQHDAQLVAQRGGAAAERGGLVRHGGAAADRFGERAERVEQDQAGFARRRQRVRRHPDAVVEQAGRATGRGDACRRGAAAAAGIGAQRAIERDRSRPAPRRWRAGPASATAVKNPRPAPCSPSVARCSGVPRVHDEVGLAEHPLGVVDQRLDAVVADRDAEVLRRDVLELVGLVDHQRRALRDHLAEGVVAQRRVGAEQVVVDDDHVRFGRALAHPRDEAVGVARAGAAGAGLGGGGDLRPERQVVGQLVDLGAVPGLGDLGPGVDQREVHAIDVGAQRRRFLEDLVALQAEVVAAALHARGRERHRQHAGEQRQILGEDLLLQVLGAGRDDHALAAQDRRHEVGERLAGAGAGLDEEHAAVLERVGDRRGHAALAVARLEGDERLRQRPVGAEDRVDAGAERHQRIVSEGPVRSRGGGRSGRAGTRRRAPRRRPSPRPGSPRRRARPAPARTATRRDPSPARACRAW